MAARYQQKLLSSRLLMGHAFQTSFQITVSCQLCEIPAEWEKQTTVSTASNPAVTFWYKLCSRLITRYFILLAAGTLHLGPFVPLEML